VDGGVGSRSQPPNRGFDLFRQVVRSAQRLLPIYYEQGRRARVESMIFLRYHLLQAVRLLVDRACSEGIGNNYLIEHSAGSGKSNTIGWLAHRLASAACMPRVPSWTGPSTKTQPCQPEKPESLKRRLQTIEAGREEAVAAAPDLALPTEPPDSMEEE
jgi:hypothetical protein